MQGAKDLIDSERGIWCALVLVVAFALVIMKAITGQAWIDFMKWISITLVMSKTATTAIDQFIGKEPPAAAG